MNSESEALLVCDRRQMRMLDGVKLAPADNRQYDKANHSGNGEAKTNVYESQQSRLRDHQSLK